MSIKLKSKKIAHSLVGTTRKDSTNLYCRLEDLDNEASVEQFFVSRMLMDLGYTDKQIKTKNSIQKLVVSLGRRKINYKPDYAVQVQRKIRWIIEAKATSEKLADYIGQCAGYCLSINRGYAGENPAKYFMLTNGVSSHIYEWDRDDPILDLSFSDFVEGNTKYQQFRDLLKQGSFSQETAIAHEGPTHSFQRKTIDEINTDFAWCHQFIYKKDNLSQSAAFMEFVKVVFLKLLSDRDIHNKHPEFAAVDKITLPAAEVRFSKRWIEERETDHPNPLDALQFQSLLQRLEEEIKQGTKKRIFRVGEKLDLSPGTIKGVVERLEQVDLFGIDADLNGRLFETFLNATMRGKDLGQYFTPRSVVKLAVKLADLKVGRDHTDTVLDGCCGSGGFLIDALADMQRKVAENRTLSNVEKDRLNHLIATNKIYGIDVAREPPLASIARMNMYLHGDGGSSIYQADALDMTIRDIPTDSPELKQEKNELRNKLGSGDFADVILTNPPFAKIYQREHKQDADILDQYELSIRWDEGKRQPLPSLKSSLMFLERYHRLVKSGGRLITIIDDSILGGDSYRREREYIRNNFIIRAVISLPGDAFQRSRARVKTSLICLEKKKNKNDNQPDIFMYYCTAVGIDDTARQRILAVDAENRKTAKHEIEQVCKLYKAFLRGDPIARKYSVTPETVADRFDVKSCLPKPGRLIKTWRQQGITVSRLLDIVDVVDPDTMADNDLIDTNQTSEIITFLRIRYDGFAEPGDEISTSDTNYSRLCRIHTNDIVISHINAVNGAIAVIPKSLDGLVVSSEFTICRAKKGYDPKVIWSLLRSPELRSDLLLLASGIGRHRVRAVHAEALQIPIPRKGLSSKIVKLLSQAEEKEQEAAKARKMAQQLLEGELGLGTEKAKKLLSAFKPPK